MRSHDLNKPMRLGRNRAPFAHDHAVGAVGKPLADGDHRELFVAGDADAHDDGDTETEFDVGLDHFPTADLELHVVRQAVFGELALDDAPGAQLARRKDQWILADVGERDALALGERMIERGDQERLIRDDGMEGDVLRDLEEMKPLRRREQPRMDSLAA